MQRAVFALCFTCPLLTVLSVQEEVASAIISKRVAQPLESDDCDFLAAFVADLSHSKIGYAITLSQGKSGLYEIWPGLASRNSTLNKKTNVY